MMDTTLEIFFFVETFFCEKALVIMTQGQRYGFYLSYLSTCSHMIKNHLKNILICKVIKM